MLKDTTILKERYELQSEPGNVATGGILFAFDQVLGGKTVVVREMPVYLSGPNARAEELRRFYEEARQLASLDHPNLVSVNDYFEHCDRAYLVMAFVDGQRLAAAWSGRDIPMQEAVDWMDQIGGALEYLHAQRPPVAFRVLEPDNVTVDPTGRVRLTHFDIAHTLGTGQWINKPGRGAGAAEFVSPEQRGGAGGDERSDIYSLGAIMYTMFTGKRPPASLELASKSASLPRPREVYPLIPAALEGIILKAMAVNKGDRFQTVRELRDALARVSRAELQGPTGVTAGSGGARRSPAPVFASQPDVRQGARAAGRKALPRPVASRPSTVFFDASVKEEIDQPGELVDQGPRKAVVATVLVGVGLAAGLCWRTWQPATPPPAGGQGPVAGPVSASSPAPASQNGAPGAVSEGRSTAITALHVESSPRGAVVLVDGHERGVTPMTIQVKPGRHVVQVRKELYETSMTTVPNLLEKTTRSINVALRQVNAVQQTAQAPLQRRTLPVAAPPVSNTQTVPTRRPEPDPVQENPVELPRFPRPAPAQTSPAATASPPAQGSPPPPTVQPPVQSSPPLKETHTPPPTPTTTPTRNPLDANINPKDPKQSQ